MLLHSLLRQVDPGMNLAGVADIEIQGISEDSRLVRTGDLFQAYQSTDGVTWRLVGSETILMGETVYVGLPVTSHNTSARTTAVISNVRVTATSQPNQPPAVSITSPASTTSRLTCRSRQRCCWR